MPPQKSDTSPALLCRGATRRLAYHQSRNQVRKAVERLEQSLSEHDLFVNGRTSPRSKAEFHRIVGLCARLAAAVDSWSGA